MKKKVYIETTVISLLTARLSTNLVVAGHQAATHLFWEHSSFYDGYYSEIVLGEARKGDSLCVRDRLEKLETLIRIDSNDIARNLTKRLLEQKAVPSQYPDDAAHIAVATAHGMDYIVTWNFKHINNQAMKEKIYAVIRDAGFLPPIICSPEEFWEDMT